MLKPMHRPSEWYRTEDFIFGLCQGCDTFSDENCSQCFVGMAYLIALDFDVNGYNPTRTFRQIDDEFKDTFGDPYAPG